MTKDVTTMIGMGGGSQKLQKKCSDITMCAFNVIPYHNYES